MEIFQWFPLHKITLIQVLGIHRQHNSFFCPAERTVAVFHIAFHIMESIIDYFAQVDWLSMLLSQAEFGDLGDSDNSRSCS